MKLFNVKFARIVLIGILVGVFSFSFASEEPVQPCKPEEGKPRVPFLNAVVSLEQKDKKKGPIIECISIAIRLSIPVICTTSLLHQMATQTPVLDISPKWAVFLNEDQNKNRSIAVLIPCLYPDSLLQEFGFVLLKHISSDKVKETFENPELAKEIDFQLLVDSFGKLFDTSKKVAKRFYVIGHGMTDSLIAGIPISVESSSGRKVALYMQFLKILNDIGAEFVYIVSCYSGGPNLVRVQNEVILEQNKVFQVARREKIEEEKKAKPEDIFSAAKIKYILGVQATTDEVTLLYGALNEFFVNLNKFFKKPRFFLGKGGIVDVLKPLYKPDPHILRLPSVRFPGTNSFFRAVNVAEMKIITYFDVKKLRTQRILREAARRAVGAPPMIQELFITIGKDIKYCLVYPCDMNDIELNVYSSNVRFISKIPGSAQHYIGTMRPLSQTSDVISMLAQAFLAYFEAAVRDERMIYKFGESPKAWFIKRLTYLDESGKQKEIYDVVIHKYAAPGNQPSSVPFGRILFREEGVFYAIEGKDITVCEPIDEKEYADTIVDIYLETQAMPAALKEASGGGEDSATEQAAFADFIRERIILKELHKKMSERFVTAEHIIIPAAREVIRAQNVERTQKLLHILTAKVQVSDDIIETAKLAVLSPNTDVQLAGVTFLSELVKKDFGNIRNKEEAYTQAAQAAQRAVLVPGWERWKTRMVGRELFDKLIESGKAFDVLKEIANELLKSGEPYAQDLLQKIKEKEKK